jgi:hypothetical protein
VSSRVCCWAIAIGRKSECTSSKAITLRIGRIVLQNQSTDDTDFAANQQNLWIGKAGM